ncbi:SusC/RagA family TonB-linked outer membrane protein [Paraflavitalea soli]|uniref:SusC/RagA family TonB-linked outer membrane protein n=1 Tax=Paraflavitalea soli TaxID=2315862 RepID=UPI0013C45E51|nr:SusC/RagA family TonB-linked outer membrane protein [Paraflavitalea soli]
MKDADATSIYGSRGANGVILITTRQGAVGKPTLTLKAEQGIVQSSYQPVLLSNHQYVNMRLEAIQAIGAAATAANAPDLHYLDLTDYQDIPKLLIGGTGSLTNLHMSVSGGDTVVRYFVSCGLFREGTVLPGSFARKRMSSYGNIQYQTPNRRFRSDLAFSFSFMDQISPAADPMYSIKLVPMLPRLRDEAGNLVWKKGDFHFPNPLGQFYNTNSTQMKFLIGSWLLEYRLFNELTLGTNLGYQFVPVDEQQLLTVAAQDSFFSPTSERSAGINTYRSWLIEPQISWLHNKGTIIAGGLLGATFQEENNDWEIMRRMGYESDAMLDIPGKAKDSIKTEYASRYRYHGVYGRGHFSWRNRYLVNATARLDASSRFGAARPWAFFGAMGTAWVFSQEQWMQDLLPRLTHGKLRASYGSSGNDQIGDYTFLELWMSNNRLIPYGGTTVLSPVREANPWLGWEKNVKAEIALELEWKGKIFLNAAYYRNISSDQVVSIQMPDQVGPASSLLINAPAAVMNRAWEFSLQSTVKWAEFNRWTSSFNLTIPHNELYRFKGLAQTTYASTLVVGKSLSILHGYPFLGVDTATGLFIVPAGNSMGSPATWPVIMAGDSDPRWYAGWSNECQLGQFRFSVLLEARDQRAINPLYSAYATMPPGRWEASMLTNQPVEMLQRWQKKGDQTSLQRWTIATDEATNRALQYYKGSTDWITNAFFLRIRNIDVSWKLPSAWIKPYRLKDINVYVRGQNVWTFTGYRGGDPTLQSPFKLPSLRMLTIGLQVQFQ